VEDEDDDKEDTQLGNQSKDDKPGWATDPISKLVKHYMGRFLLKPM
jgi:hypothetical protein